MKSRQSADGVALGVGDDDVFDDAADGGADGQVGLGCWRLLGGRGEGNGEEHEDERGFGADEHPAEHHKALWWLRWVGETRVVRFAQGDKTLQGVENPVLISETWGTLICGWGTSRSLHRAALRSGSQDHGIAGRDDRCPMLNGGALEVDGLRQSVRMGM
jgi:hypothetical protein